MKNKLFMALLMSVMITNTSVITYATQDTTIASIASLTGCADKQIENKTSIIENTSGATKEVGINVNGKNVYLDNSTGRPFTEDNRVLVPVRVVSENLGADVKWDNTKKSFIITSKDGKTVITGYANKSVVKVNGVEKQIDESPNVVVKQLNSRLYVPIRFFAENMGCSVDYKNRTVYITTNGAQVIVPPTVGKLDKTYADFNSTKEAIEYIANTLPGWKLTDNELGTQGIAENGNLLDNNNGTVANFTIRDWYRTGDSILASDKVELEKEMAEVKELLKFYCPQDYEQIYSTVDKAVNIRKQFSGVTKNGLKVSFNSDSAGYSLVITK